MRVVIDTNILVSALLLEASLLARLLTAWREGRFDLVTSSLQIDEIRRVKRYPKLRTRLTPSLVGRLLNEIRDLAIMTDNLPSLDISRDPYDNYLLAMVLAGDATILVTGDKRDLLTLKRHASFRIISLRE